MESLQDVKNLTFDLIGTCYDWHTPVFQSLKAHAAKHERLYSRGSQHWSSFAHQWRMEFFAYLGELARLGRVLPVNDVFTETLCTLIRRHEVTEWDAKAQAEIIASWSQMKAWPDTMEGINALRSKFTIMSLTNGSMRTTIDVAKRENVRLDAILCSDVLGSFKPSPAVYQTALRALQCDAREVAMVAAHAYDLEAAAKEGFRTIYIVRETEDLGLHPSRLDKFDLVIRKGGLAELARLLTALSTQE